MATHDKKKSIGTGRRNRFPGRRLLGELLVDAGFIKESRLRQALREQQRTHELLGHILLRSGDISETELDIVLYLQKELTDVKSALRFAAGIRKKLGELLLHAHRITSEQLDEALQEQAETGFFLGEILVRRGLLTGEEIDAALRAQLVQENGQAADRIRLGELLVTAGYISPPQLTDALERQKRSGKRLGEVLVDAGYAKPHMVEQGLRLQSMLLAAILSTLLSLSFTASAAAQAPAGGSQSAIMVSAVIPAQASVKILSQPPNVLVTEEDVQRGFVEVKGASLIEMKSNSAGGCLVVIEAQGLPFKEALVNGLGGEVSIGPQGGMVTQTFLGKMRALLNVRFMLSADARPGVYQWPFVLDAMPL